MPATAAATPAPTPPYSATRLTRRQDIQAVLRDGRRARHHVLVVAFRPNGLGRNRYGFAIGKRVGNAVTRNLIRRRLRAIVRSAPLATGYDIVTTARAEAAFVTFDDLRRAFASCAERGGLIASEQG